MIKKIFNCISIHNGGGINYLSMMHNDIDKKDNLIFLDQRAKKIPQTIYLCRNNIFQEKFI